MAVIKVLGPEVSIASANSVSTLSRLVRVVNTGATAVLNFQLAAGTVYANCTVTNTTPVFVEKHNIDDKLVGANMLAAPIAYRN